MRVPNISILQMQRDEALSLREKLLERRIYSTEALRKAVQHLNSPLQERLYTVPTADQMHFVLTGFMLGCTSLVAAFFPICGLPVAITGLLLGLYGRYMTSLRTMSTWAITLSLVGLLLACLNTALMIGIYFSTYLWQ